MVVGVLTLGGVADRLNVKTWMVRRLYESGRLPPAARLGRYRVVAEADLPAIEAALKAAGYLGRGPDVPTPNAA